MTTKVGGRFLRWCPSALYLNIHTTSMRLSMVTIERIAPNRVNYIGMRRKAEPDAALDNLARNMRDRRRSLGITQEQLAEAAGLSTNYVARLEIVDSVPSFATLASLAKALDVKVYELLSGDAEQPWLGPAREIARVMEGLNAQDSRFVLDQLQSTVGYLKSIRDR